MKTAKKKPGGKKSARKSPARASKKRSAAGAATPALRAVAERERNEPEGQQAPPASGGRATGRTGYDKNDSQVIQYNLRNIANHKQTEEKLRRALEFDEAVMKNMAEGLYTVDDQGLVTSMNPAAEKLFGWSFEELRGRKMHDMTHHHHPDGRPFPAEECAGFQVLKQGKTLSGHEDCFIRKDGTFFDVIYSASPLRDRDNVIGLVVVFRDITERKQAEENLRESEERYRNLFNSMDEGYCVIEMIFDAQQQPVDYRFVEVNGAFERQSGMRDVIGRRMLEFVSEIEAHWLANYGQVALTGEPIRFANEYKGLHRWFDVYAFRVGEPESRRVAILFNDITGRKEAEERLRESEERFRTMADNMSQFAWMADAAGWIFWYNKRWFDYTGTTLQEMEGWGWKKVHHPAHVERVVARIQQSWDTGEIWEDTFPLRGKDGNYRWFLSRALPIRDGEGKIVRWFGTNTDVTEVREAEEALRESKARLDFTLESARVGDWDLDLITDQARRSLRHDQAFGYDEPIAEWGYEKFLTHVHPDNRAEVDRKFKAALAEVKEWHFECRVIWPDGSVHWIEAHGNIYRTVAGQPRNMLGIVNDITARKTAEESLRRALEEVERTSRAKDEFIATLSHELRTPLTPVLMTAAALETDPVLSLEVRDQLGMIRRNIELEARLIDDLLDLTRISHGKLQIQPAIADLHQLLNHTAEIVRSEGMGKRVDTRFVLEAARHHTKGDPARLQQVFWNIIKNALKFTPAGGSVTVSTHNDEAGMIIVSVADTGIGIRPEVLPHIFKAFEQGETAFQQRFGGLGLGLAISRAIVEVHGGVIHAESEGVGRGATFRIALATADPPQVVDGAQSAPLAPARALRLLVVEDHEATLTVLARLLTRSGHRVTPARTIGEALAAAALGSFDAVISDLGLPDGSGLDLLREIRREHDWPAITLSGFGMEKDVSQAKEAGFFAHFVKPVNLDELLQLLAQIEPRPA